MRRDSINFTRINSRKSEISIGLHVVTLSKQNFCLLYRPNTISEAADFKEGAAYNKERTHIFEVLYIQNYNMCGRSL